MSKEYWVCADGICGYEEYPYYVDDDFSEDEMLEDVRANLKELEGGHADIFDTETDELFAEIEV